MSTKAEDRLLAILRKLSPERVQEVLAFAEALSLQEGSKGRLPRGVPGERLLVFAGRIASEDVADIKRAIEEDCEQVTTDEW